MNASTLEQDRANLHSTFRKLGFTTNGQTSDLLDVVFDYLIPTLNAVYEECAQAADKTHHKDLAFISSKIRALKIKE